jgi:glycogen(starch) synthase
MAPRPLRVLRLCSVFEPPASALRGRGAGFDPVGGMQEHTGTLTRVLAERGVEQVVLTTRPPTAPWLERLAPRATIVRVGLPVRRPRQLYAVPAAVLAPLLGLRADLVHVHLGEDLAVIPLAALAAAPRGLPVVLTVHCSPTHTLRGPGARTAVLRSLGGWIERQGERRAAATIVFTSRLAERLAADGLGASVHVIRRGIDRRAFAPAAVASADELPWPAADGRRRVVFLGRVVRAKGVETLVEAVSRMRTAGVQVLLVGDGPDRARVERLARRLGVADRVQVTGFVPHEQVPAVLHSADLLVLPSLYEELGTVLVEAMQVGLPVVASRVGGIPETIEHGVTGLLVAPGDAGALAAAIDAVVGDGDPALCRRLRANADRRAEDYDVQRTADAVHGLYARLVEGRAVVTEPLPS